MAVKILGALDVTGSMGITASDVPGLPAGQITSGTFSSARIPNLAASKITSGTLNASRIPNLDASKITTGTISSARLPAGSVSYTPDKYLFQTATTYTSSNAKIALADGQNMDGTTNTNKEENTITFSADGIYLVSWNINWENEVANRNNFGASAKLNGSVIQGGTDVQYFRYHTYGHKSTTSTTFVVQANANQYLEFFTFLQHGTANHKVTSVNGDGGAITILRLS